ncbi:MFS transporter [Saccharopolyspora cebuensis]|uniref:MFS transporter n=1 Tax=Saccharopolyspora cebuensis TaxID=418759 RepID=A0ABV4CQW1_9PSEU
MSAEERRTAVARVPWRQYAGVYLLLFLIGTETFIVAPLLPTIASSLAVPETAAAATVTAYPVAYAVTAPFLGTVTDRFGRYPMIVVGAVLFLLGNVVAAVAGSLAVLMAGRVLGALGAAAAGPAIWAHLAETAPEAARGRSISVGNALFAAGQVFGVPAGAFLAGASDWRSSFWVLAGLSALVLPLCFATTRVLSRESRHEPQPLRLLGAFAVWKDGVLRHTLAVVVLLHAANLGTYTYLGVILHQRFGLSVDALGFLGLFVGIGSAVGSLVAGRIGDRARAAGSGGARWVPVWCLLLGLGVVTAVLGSPAVVSYGAALVWFLASGAFVTAVQTLLLDERPELGATSSSWNTALLYGGTAVGVGLIGLFPQVQSGAAVVGGGLALAAALLALPLAARRRPEGAPEPARRAP